MFFGKKSSKGSNQDHSHFIIVRQLQQKPSSPNKSPTLCESAEPSVILPSGGFTDLSEIHSVDEKTVPQQERLKLQFEMLLPAIQDPQQKKDRVTELAIRIRALECIVASLNDELEQNIQEYRINDLGLNIPAWENRIDSANLDRELLLAEIKTENNSLEHRLRVHFIDGLAQPEPMMLQQIALSLIICKEKLERLTILYERGQSTNIIATKVNKISLLCCNFR